MPPGPDASSRQIASGPSAMALPPPSDSGGEGKQSLRVGATEDKERSDKTAAGGGRVS